MTAAEILAEIRTTDPHVTLQQVEADLAWLVEAGLVTVSDE